MRKSNSNMTVNDFFQKINEELDELKESVYTALQGTSRYSKCKSLNLNSRDIDYISKKALDLNTTITSMLDAIGTTISKEHEFKIGDRVRIRKNLIHWKPYNNWVWFVPEMELFEDKIVEINEYVEICGKIVGYKVSGNDYTWSDDMLEPIKHWKPNYGEKYYVWTSGSGVIQNTWEDDVIDESHYKNGFIFKTEEEAQKLGNAVLSFIRRL